jgi:hypothetical protein
VEKDYLRPAVHLLVEDDSPTVMYECIFTSDPLIKYAHDVTRATKEAAAAIGRKKLIVLALQPDVASSKGVYSAIFDKLQHVGMVGSNAVLLDQYWQDIYLPRLEDSDLEQMKAAFGEQLEYLKTALGVKNSVPPLTHTSIGDFFA